MKIIGYGNVSVLGLQGAGAGELDRYIGSGQAVVGVPDDAKSLAAMDAILNPPPSFIDGAVRQRASESTFLGWLRGMCRVQYSVMHANGNRTFSGYVPVERLDVQ